MVDLYNKALNNAFTPEQWKSANITPIPKIPKPTEPTDYRPIAILSTADKTFQRVLAKYMVSVTKDLWKSNKQYGFLPGRSTMDAICQVIEDWTRTIDQKDHFTAIFFDFEKAFDLVNHELLLEKLSNLLPTWLISWIASYLTSRKQRVKTGQLSTNWLNVEAGVIQGSVIGPILFILFISDINKYIPNDVEIDKYADDILNYIMGDHSSISQSILPQAIADGVNNWCHINQMRLNAKKCKIMTTTIQPIIPVNINGHQIEVVSSYKYLGANMSHILDWDQQWERVKKMISSLPYLIKQLKRIGFKLEILINIYRTHGLSHFIYSAPMLSSCSDHAKLEMENFQRRILKIVNLDPEIASSKFDIKTISKLIDKTNVNILANMLKDSKHPITAKLTKNNRAISTNRVYNTNLANTEAYKNSFVQKYLRVIRDGTDNLYLPRNLKNYNTTISKVNNVPTSYIVPKDNAKLRFKCKYCLRDFAGLQLHLKRNPICRLKNEEWSTNLGK
jgi:hypothetical protein